MAHRPWNSQDSVLVVHGLSCSSVCRILPDQVSNLCPLHWQMDSYQREVFDLPFKQDRTVLGYRAFCGKGYISMLHIKCFSASQKFLLLLIKELFFVAVAIAIDHLKWFYKLLFKKKNYCLEKKVNLSVLGSELPLVPISYSEFSQNFCFLA